MVCGHQLFVGLAESGQMEVKFCLLSGMMVGGAGEILAEVPGLWYGGMLECKTIISPYVYILTLRN